MWALFCKIHAILREMSQKMYLVWLSTGQVMFMFWNIFSSCEETIMRKLDCPDKTILLGNVDFVGKKNHINSDSSNLWINPCCKYYQLSSENLDFLNRIWDYYTNGQHRWKWEEIYWQQKCPGVFPLNLSLMFWNI